MRYVSTAGYVCQAIMGIFLVILTSLTVSTNWWIVYFWDCLNDEDAAIYILLVKGICIDPDEGQVNLKFSCT